MKKRPCGCPAAQPWVPPAAPTRSEARQQPTILLGPALWAGSGRAAERERGGGEGGEATLRKRGPHTCTRTRARIIDPCAFLHAEATWLRARRRRHQGHREDLARKVLRPGRLVRGVLTSYFNTRTEGRYLSAFAGRQLYHQCLGISTTWLAALRHMRYALSLPPARSRVWLARVCGSRRVQPLSVAQHMQAGMQHPSLDGYEEVGVLGRG